MEHVTPDRLANFLEIEPANFHASAPSSSQTMPDTTSGSKDAVPDEPHTRTHLSTPRQNFELLASRTVSQAISEEACNSKFPTSPLTSISPRLYPRFPRFSTATENSHPDLSTDEVTSTRISLDEEGIVTPPATSKTKPSKRQKLQVTLHRAVSSSSLEWKRVGHRIKRVPSALLQRRSSNRAPRTSEKGEKEVVAQPADIKHNMTCSPSTSVDGERPQRKSADSQPPFITPTKADARSEHKLPDLLEIEASDSETAVSQGQLDTINPGAVPGPAVRTTESIAPMKPVHPSITKMRSYHSSGREKSTQKRQAFLGRAASWSNSHLSPLPRSISLGSIDELRCNSFISSQQRVLSMPTIPSRQSSQVGLTGGTPRQPPRALSICEIEDLNSQSQLQRDPMFIDLQGHQVNFVLPPAKDLHSDSASPEKSAANSKAHSYRSLRSRENAPLLVRSSSTTSGLGEKQGRVKIPLFVPSQIIKPATSGLMVPDRQSSRLSANAALGLRESQQDEQSAGRGNGSREALSEESDWSTTVQFEAPKKEVFQAKSEASVVLDRTMNDRPESRQGQVKQPEGRREVLNRVTLSGLNDGEGLVRGPDVATDRHPRYLRLFQNWNAYIKRVKQHLWKSSKGTVTSV